LYDICKLERKKTHCVRLDKWSPGFFFEPKFEFELLS